MSNKEVSCSCDQPSNYTALLVALHSIFSQTNVFVWYFAKKSLLSFAKVCEHFVNTHLHVTSQHKFNSMQTNFVMVYYVSTLYFSSVHELFHELYCNYYTVLASWVSYSWTYSWHLFISITHINVHKQFMNLHELLMKVNEVGGNFSKYHFLNPSLHTFTG